MALSPNERNTKECHFTQKSEEKQRDILQNTSYAQPY